MSDFSKKLYQYRQGDNWRENFKNINYVNVEASLRSILTKKEPQKVYDRLGNHVATTGKLVPLTLDETIFRVMVLMDTQIKERPMTHQLEELREKIQTFKWYREWKGERIAVVATLPDSQVDAIMQLITQHDAALIDEFTRKLKAIRDGLLEAEFISTAKTIDGIIEQYRSKQPIEEHQLTCPSCEGACDDVDGVICPVCAGTGKLEYQSKPKET